MVLKSRFFWFLPHLHLPSLLRYSTELGQVGRDSYAKHPSDLDENEPASVDFGKSILWINPSDRPTKKFQFFSCLSGQIVVDYMKF
jgi:hypothetical protein